MRNSYRFRHPRRGRKPKPQGFSRPGSKQIFDLIGIPKSERRDYFNMMSGLVVLTGAFVSLGAGWFWTGPIGGVLSGFVGFAVASHIVTRERMSR